MMGMKEDDRTDTEKKCMFIGQGQDKQDLTRGILSYFLAAKTNKSKTKQNKSNQIKTIINNQYYYYYY